MAKKETKKTVKKIVKKVEEVKKVERRGRPRLADHLKKNKPKPKIPGRGRGRPKLDPSQRKNSVKVKVPGRGRGRPPLDPLLKKTKPKKSGKRGRPAGSLNKINFFSDNTPYVHLRMWEIGIIKSIVGRGEYELDELKKKIKLYKSEHDEFYKPTCIINDQKIDVYGDLIDYMTNEGVLNYSKRSKLYSYNNSFKMR